MPEKVYICPSCGQDTMETSYRVIQPGSQQVWRACSARCQNAAWAAGWGKASATTLIGEGDHTWRVLEDGSSWPAMETDEVERSLAHRLRYNPETLTPTDCKYLATVLYAYETLIYEATRGRVSEVRNALRAARKEARDAGD
jgi:hypothetical protein